MSSARHRMRGEITPAEALAIVDGHVLSPSPRMTIGIFVGLMGSMAVLVLAHIAGIVGDIERPIPPDELFFRLPQELSTREVYGLYVVYSVTPVCIMFSYVFHLNARQKSVTKRNYSLAWAIKSFIAVFTALVTLFKIMPALATPSGLIIYTGNIVSTIGTDIFFLVVQASNAPWSSRRLKLSLAVEITYKCCGYLSGVASGPLGIFLYVNSFVLGCIQVALVIMPTRPPNESGTGRLVTDVTIPQSMLTRRQAMATGALMASARLLMSLHFTITTLTDPAVDYDSTRIVLFATMIQELVVPSVILHLAFSKVDSLVLGLMAAERDRHSMSRIDAQHHVVRWVCHEVRVPLSSVSLGIADVNATLRDVMEENMIAPGALHEHAVDMTKSLGIMARALDRMQAVLNDMLTYEKLQHGQLQFNPRRFNLHSSVADVIHQFSQVAAAKKVHLFSRHAPFGDQFAAYTSSRGDRTRIMQVVSNFASNALKFVSDDDEVVIEYAAFLRPPPGCGSRWSAAIAPHHSAPSAQPGRQSAIGLALRDRPNLLDDAASQIDGNLPAAGDDRMEDDDSESEPDETPWPRAAGGRLRRLRNVGNRRMMALFGGRRGGEGGDTPQEHEPASSGGADDNAHGAVDSAATVCPPNNGADLGPGTAGATAAAVPSGGEASEGGSRVLICVRVLDTGTGIKQQQQGRLFQPFSQLRSGEEQGGTGLGLAICRAIAEMHGGFVGLWSAGVGHGSEFWMEWAFELARPPSRAAITPAGAMHRVELPAVPQIPGLPAITYAGTTHNPMHSASGGGWRAGAFESDEPREIDAALGRRHGCPGGGIAAAADLGTDTASGDLPLLRPQAARAPHIPILAMPPGAASAGAPTSREEAISVLPALPQVPGLSLRFGSNAESVDSAQLAPAPLPPLPLAPGLAQRPLSGRSGSNAAAGTAWIAHGQQQGYRAQRAAPLLDEVAAAGQRAAALPSQVGMGPEAVRPNRHQLEGLRIAVVDDQLGNRELLAKHLRRRGARVVTAEDGVDFVAQLAAGLDFGGGGGEALQVVLLDKEMPRMTGYDVLAVLAAAHGHDMATDVSGQAADLIRLYGVDLDGVRAASEGLCVVGVTGNALREDVDEYIRRGATAVVTKPVNMDDLLDTVLRVTGANIGDDGGEFKGEES